MNAKNLSEYKFIITGGPTREWLDPFRFISNPSSGKMGVSIADAAYTFTHNVIFIHGPVDDTLISGKQYQTRLVDTTQSMCTAVLDALSDKAVLIMAAAPVDYTPVERSETKIKKKHTLLTLELKPTPDILKSAVQYSRDKNYKDFITVGFAAETNNTEEYAKKKLIEKELDYICLNNISIDGAGFVSDTNLLTVFSRNGKQYSLPKKTKTELAFDILSIISGGI
jgi:phosphopantothenoylcysteine decarboxylase/phosphopantothenate--cysteine ligase